MTPTPFPTPFAPPPATAADVLLIAALAGGHVEPDPETGRLRLTPSGRRLAGALFPPPVPAPGVGA
ncbi:MAG: hypothetical protein C0501_17505 [Isosphaera sp.]|nr:hypothetical protein [Isosphaera sp.]